MKKNILIGLVIGLTIIVGVYSLLTASKYHALTSKIEGLQQSQLAGLDERAASIKYRFSTLINDSKITDKEIINVAFLIEEFRNLTKPYGALTPLDEDEGAIVAMQTVYGKAWKVINIKPSDITVNDVKKIENAIDQFRNDVKALGH
ncbi:hypothetical protein [Paenibacillus taichungensis]|uniref:hypothetical protein n=1 Tax=Paenibacillus taichungensis TaxID=484184 RepID=UPI00399F133B